MTFLNDIKKKWKIFFCWGLSSLSILFSLLVFIIKPQAPTTYYPYSYSKRTFENVQFPLIQHFKSPGDSLKQIHLHLSDKTIFNKNQSINQYDYDIKVYDEDNKIYYSNHFHNYTLDYVDIELERALDNNNKDKDLILKIDCEECNDVKMSLKSSNNKSTDYIESKEDNKILEFSVIYLISNNSYYWYTLVGITISLILYPLAKEDITNEK